jgi:hypothetical protein
MRCRVPRGLEHMLRPASPSPCASPASGLYLPRQATMGRLVVCAGDRSQGSVCLYMALTEPAPPTLGAQRLFCKPNTPTWAQTRSCRGTLLTVAGHAVKKLEDRLNHRNSSSVELWEGPFYRWKRPRGGDVHAGYGYGIRLWALRYALGAAESSMTGRLRGLCGHSDFCDRLGGHAIGRVPHAGPLAEASWR